MAIIRFENLSYAPLLKKDEVHDLAKHFYAGKETGRDIGEQMGRKKTLGSGLARMDCLALGNSR